MTLAAMAGDAHGFCVGVLSLSLFFFVWYHEFLRIILCMPIQTELLRGLRKSSGETGIVIPVKKVPQERKIEES